MMKSTCRRRSCCPVCFGKCSQLEATLLVGDGEIHRSGEEKGVWSYFRNLPGRTALNCRPGVGVFNSRVCPVRVMRDVRQFPWYRASILGAQTARARWRLPLGEQNLNGCERYTSQTILLQCRHA